MSTPTPDSSWTRTAILARDDGDTVIMTLPRRLTDSDRAALNALQLQVGIGCNWYSLKDEAQLCSSEAISLATAGVLTPNEARRALGLDPGGTSANTNA